MIRIGYPVHFIRRNITLLRAHLPEGERPGQTNTNRVVISGFLNCHIFLAFPGLFLQKLEVV
jgi:hypothetical protein